MTSRARVLFGGHIRVSTLVLIVGFLALLALYLTVRPEISARSERPGGHSVERDTGRPEPASAPPAATTR